MKVDEKKQYVWNNVGHQYFAAIIANSIMLGHGAILGWISPVIPLLKSEDTPLASGPLTSAQLSWIGSIMNIGAIFGSPMFSCLASMIGYKRAMIFLTFPSMMCWFLIFFGNSYYYIVCARLVCGLTAGGIQTVVVLFISEIANDDIRGRLSSFLYLSRNIGILFSYVIGSFIQYQYLPCICVLILVIYAAIFIFLPNTPKFHLERHEIQKAEKSLKYYKGYKGENNIERMAFDKEFDRVKAQLSKTTETDKACLNLSDICERKALVGIGTGILLAFFTQLTGSLTLLSYAVLIFQKSGSTIDPYLSSIIMAILQIVGSLCTAQLVDSLGRKALIITSLVGSAIGLAVLSLYSYLNLNGYDLENYSWLPVTSLSFVVFISSVGICSLVNVCTVENLPIKVRNVGITISTITLYIFAFMCTKYFPVWLEIIELHGCLSIFAASSAIGSIFVFFCVRETKGQSMNTEKK